MKKIIKCGVINLFMFTGLVEALEVNVDTEATFGRTATQELHQIDEVKKVSDQKLEQFVIAYVVVQRINQDYSAQLQAAVEPERAIDLQLEAQRKMQKAVNDSGLTMPEYQRIAELVAQDAELRARVHEQLPK